jgi:hypothetical protein
MQDVHFKYEGKSFFVLSNSARPQKTISLEPIEVYSRSELAGQEPGSTSISSLRLRHHGAGLRVRY